VEGGLLELAMTDVLNQVDEDVQLELQGDAVADIYRFNHEILDVARGRVRDALRLDEDSVFSTTRKIRLKASMLAQRGMGEPVAMTFAKQGALGAIAFKRMDRAGRQWSSDIYSRTVTRGMLVTAYVDNYLMSVLSNGQDLAKTTSDEGTDLVFSITGTTPGYPSLEEIRDTYFHPNASRLVSHAQ
jgi:hypothetical protein